MASMPEAAGSYIERTDLLEFAMAKYRHSRDADQGFREKLLGYYNLNNCIYTGQSLPYKNKVMLPLLFSAMWTDIALKIQTSLGEFPYVEARAISPEMTQSARRVTAITNEQADDARIIDKMVDFLGSSEGYGTGVLRHGWAHVTRRHKMRQKFGGRIIERAVDIIEVNRPDFTVVDLLNFFPAVGYKRIADMPHCHHGYMTDYDTLLREQADALKEGYPLYDPAALAELGRRGWSGGVEGSTIAERQSAHRSYSEWEARRTEEFAKPVEIIEFWGLVPQELAIDGYEMVVITIANGTIVLRAECNPHWHALKPFFSYSPMPDPHFFWGQGKVAIGSRMAMAANKLVSGRLDAIEMFLGPAFFAAEGLSLGGQSLALWPGRVVRVNGAVDDSRIKPISPDLRGTQLVYTEVDALARYLTQGHGLHEDTLQGLQSSNKPPTAREFIGRMESGRGRIGLESRLFEINVLEPLFHIMHRLNRQHLTLPQMVSLIGSSALVDINTGMPLPPEPESVTLDDINGNYRWKAKGATQLISQSMRRQEFLSAIQVCAAVPAAMVLTNFQNVLRKLWLSLGEDPNEMMNVQIPYINALGLQGGSPNGGDSMAALQNLMPQLDPDTLGPQPQNAMQNAQPPGGY